MNELTFPLDIGRSAPSKHLARLVHEQVENIPDETLNEFYKSEDCPSYTPKMMLKIILFVYSRVWQKD